MIRVQNNRLKEMKSTLQKKMSALSPTSFPESTDRSRSRALKQRFMQPNVEEVTSIPTHSFRPSKTIMPSQSSQNTTVPAGKDQQLRVKQLEDSRLAILRQEALSEEVLYKREEDLIRDMMALYQECVTATEEERRKRSEERKRCVATVVKEVEKKKEVAPKPLASFGGPVESKKETGGLLNGKEGSTPKPPAPSFVSFSLGTKTDNTGSFFGTKSDAAKSPAPSFGGSFGSKNENGPFGAKKEGSEATPKPPALSFVGGAFGKTENPGGLFGSKQESTPKPPAPSFANASLFGAKKETGCLFSAKASETAPKPPAPSFGNSGLFSSANGRLFGSKKDDSSKPAFPFGQFGNGEAPKPPSFSSGSSGLFVTKKDIPK